MVSRMNPKVVEIPYSLKKISLEIPSSCEIDIIEPNKGANDHVFNLKHKSSEFFKDQTFKSLQNKTVMIIVNDATRATPTEILLDELIPFFKNLNISYDFIIATGSHRNPTIDELKSIFGKFYPKIQNRIFGHDSKDEAQLLLLGKTSFGTEVKVNKRLFDSRYAGIVTINSIEPHYFAGWTGGRKSVVPGLAGYETITKTHIHALSSESQNCRLEGNPVHDDLQEGFDFFLNKINKIFYTFQFVIDSTGTIHELFAGDYSVFQKGVEYSSKIFQVPIEKEYELVIAVAYPPLDQDLYQSHKALENCKPAIKKDDSGNKSIFILVSACKNGIGPDQFLVPFKTNPQGTFDELMKEITEHYKLGFHKAGKILEAEEYAELYIFSNLDNETAKAAHFKSITGDLSKFINNKIADRKIERIALVLDACVTVPTISLLEEH